MEKVLVRERERKPKRVWKTRKARGKTLVWPEGARWALRTEWGTLSASASPARLVSEAVSILASESEWPWA